MALAAAAALVAFGLALPRPSHDHLPATVDRVMPHGVLVSRDDGGFAVVPLHALPAGIARGDRLQGRPHAVASLAAWPRERSW